MNKYMKTRGTIFAALAIPVVILSCGTPKEMKPAAQKIPVIPEIIGSEASRQLVSADGKDTVESKVAYSFYSVPKFPFQDSINYHIGKFVWETTEFETTPYEYKPLSHYYFHQRMDSFEKMYKDYIKDAEYPTIWSYEAAISLDLKLKDYVQLNRQLFIYTGGAHPNSSFLLTLVSKEDGNTVLLKDLVTDVKAFNKIAEKHFRIAREIKPSASLKDEYWFENGVFICNDNFVITPQGIKFVFNAYEIAPYAFGVTEFTVPMSEIKGLLAVKLEFQEK